MSRRPLLPPSFSPAVLTGDPYVDVMYTPLGAPALLSNSADHDCASPSQLTRDVPVDPHIVIAVLFRKYGKLGSRTLFHAFWDVSIKKRHPETPTLFSGTAS